MGEERMYKEVGKRIDRLRTHLGLTQVAFCAKHGFSTTQYTNWKSGLRRPSVDEAMKLVDAYGLTLDFIFRGREDGLSENMRKVFSDM